MVPPHPRQQLAKPFLFAVDHCFPIKGQGTVLTGTVLQVRVCCGQGVHGFGGGACARHGCIICMWGCMGMRMGAGAWACRCLDRCVGARGREVQSWWCGNGVCVAVVLSLPPPLSLPAGLGVRGRLHRAPSAQAQQASAEHADVQAADDQGDGASGCRLLCTSAVTRLHITSEAWARCQVPVPHLDRRRCSSARVGPGAV